MIKKKRDWYWTDLKEARKEYSQPELLNKFEQLLELFLEKRYPSLKKLSEKGIRNTFRMDVHLFKYYYINGTNIFHKGTRKFMSPKTFLSHKFDKCDLAEGIMSLRDYEYFFNVLDDKDGAQQILEIINATLRRDALNFYGPKKFFKEMNAKIVHKEGKNELMTLKWHRDEKSLTMVKVIDSTTKQPYLLRVPSEMKTVQQARAWTFGLEEDEFYPLKEA